MQNEIFTFSKIFSAGILRSETTSSAWMAMVRNTSREQNYNEELFKSVRYRERVYKISI